MRFRTVPGTESDIEMCIERTEAVVYKRATPKGASDLQQQVDMYKDLPEEISWYYPRLLEWDLDPDRSYYKMPFYSSPTARWLLLYSSLPAHVLAERLGEVIRFVFEVQHPHRTADPPPGYIREVYIDRPLKRLRGMERVPVFRQLNQAPGIAVGDSVYRNPIHWLQALQGNQALLEDLHPPKLCFTHGQIEFEHILINLSGDEQPPFILLDARGADRLLDPAYDAGKLLQCTEGFIDFMEEDMFDMAEDMFDTAGELRSYEGVEHLHGACGYLAIPFLELGPRDRVAVCDELHKEVVSTLLDVTSRGIDPYVQRRMYLAEAAHLLGAVPYCYRDHARTGVGDPMTDLKRAIACYASGARALQQFMRSSPVP